MAICKTQTVHLSSDLQKLVKTCRRVNPFEVVNMTSAQMQSFHLVKAAIVNRKETIDKKKVEWLKMRWLHFEQCNLFQIQFHEIHNELEAWKVFDNKRKTRGRPPDLGRIDLPLLRDKPLGIPQKKVDDLLSLLDYVHHNFYTLQAQQKRTTPKKIMRVKAMTMSDQTFETTLIENFISNY